MIILRITSIVSILALFIAASLSSSCGETAVDSMRSNSAKNETTHGEADATEIGKITVGTSPTPSPSPDPEVDSFPVEVDEKFVLQRPAPTPAPVATDKAGKYAVCDRSIFTGKVWQVSEHVDHTKSVEQVTAELTSLVFKLSNSDILVFSPLKEYEINKEIKIAKSLCIAGNHAVIKESRQTCLGEQAPTIGYDCATDTRSDSALLSIKTSASQGPSHVFDMVFDGAMIAGTDGQPGRVWSEKVWKKCDPDYDATDPSDVVKEVLGFYDKGTKGTCNIPGSGTLAMMTGIGIYGIGNSSRASNALLYNIYSNGRPRGAQVRNCDNCTIKYSTFGKSEKLPYRYYTFDADGFHHYDHQITQNNSGVHATYTTNFELAHSSIDFHGPIIQTAVTNNTLIHGTLTNNTFENAIYLAPWTINDLAINNYAEFGHEGSGMKCRGHGDMIVRNTVKNWKNKTKALNRTALWPPMMAYYMFGTSPTPHAEYRGCVILSNHAEDIEGSPYQARNGSINNPDGSYKSGYMHNYGIIAYNKAKDIKTPVWGAEALDKWPGIFVDGGLTGVKVLGNDIQMNNKMHGIQISHYYSWEKNNDPSLYYAKHWGHADKIIVKDNKISIGYIPSITGQIYGFKAEGLKNSLVINNEFTMAPQIAATVPAIGVKDVLNSKFAGNSKGAATSPLYEKLGSTVIDSCSEASSGLTCGTPPILEYKSGIQVKDDFCVALSQNGKPISLSEFKITDTKRTSTRETYLILNATSGTLMLPTSANVSMKYGAFDQHMKTMVFYGTVSSLNESLKKLVYKNGGRDARIEITIVDKVKFNFPQTKDSISDPATSVIPSESNSTNVTLGCAANESTN